jgi:cell division protease FtsH
MNEKVGNVSFYKLSENSYDKPYSQKTAEIIDEEVRGIIDTEYKRALKLLTEKQSEMESLATLLLEKEVLFKDDLEKLLGKRPIEVNEEALQQDHEEENKPEV